MSREKKLSIFKILVIYAHILVKIKDYLTNTFALENQYSKHTKDDTQFKF